MEPIQAMFSHSEMQSSAAVRPCWRLHHMIWELAGENYPSSRQAADRVGSFNGYCGRGLYLQFSPPWWGLSKFLYSGEI